MPNITANMIDLLKTDYESVESRLLAAMTERNTLYDALNFVPVPPTVDASTLRPSGPPINPNRMYRPEVVNVEGSVTARFTSNMTDELRQRMQDRIREYMSHRQTGKSEMLRCLYGGAPRVRVHGAENYVPAWYNKPQYLVDKYAQFMRDRKDRLEAEAMEAKRKEDAKIGKGKAKFYRRPLPKCENQMEMFG